MGTLNLFPSRVAIGSVQPNGDVLMTPEFFRALTDLLKRVGGPSAPNFDEMQALFSIETSDVGSSVASDKADMAMLADVFDVSPAITDQCCDPVPTVGNDAAVTVLISRIEALEIQIAQQADAIASASQAFSYAQYTEIEYAFGLPPVDWEHPGKIGAASANSGKFTTLETTGKAGIGTAPSTAQLRVQVAATGTSLSLTDATNATWNISHPSVGVTLLTNGAGNTVLRDTSGAVYHGASLQAQTGFGCNGKTPQTAFALGAAATDLPTVIALANNLRTMSINNGIGS